LHSKSFRAIVQDNETPIPEVWLESIVLDLLAGKNPAQARDFVLSWAEYRHSSWADAARDAETRCASESHLPQIRGQLRYHLGEIALARAASAAKVGSMSFRTDPPGGVFILARVGRFALVSLTVRRAHSTPRPTLTRRLLSRPNGELEPQRSFLPVEVVQTRGPTQLAYLGCLVAVPWRRDPTVPAQLAFAVPDASLDGWLIWIPLHRVHAMMQQRADSGGIPDQAEPTIADKAFPKFRIPNEKDETADDGKSV
jgi:hypothetical protein